MRVSPLWFSALQFSRKGQTNKNSRKGQTNKNKPRVHVRTMVYRYIYQRIMYSMLSNLEKTGYC